MRPVYKVLLGLGIVGGVALGTMIAFVCVVAFDAGPHAVAFRNATGSMEPALLIGDYFTCHLLRDDAEVSRGSLVAFQYPMDTSKRFVKRAVGLPGDTLEMRAGRLLNNSHPIVEQHAWHSDSIKAPGTPADTSMAADFEWQDAFSVRGRTANHRSRNDWGPLVVPPSRYFVLGDNRDNSLDSRFFGFVERDQIYATPRRVYFSWDPTGHRIRWSRLGAMLH